VYLWGIGTNTYPVTAWMAIGDPELYAESAYNYEVVLSAGNDGSILIGYNPLGDYYPNVFVSGDFLYLYGDATLELESGANILVQALSGSIKIEGDALTYSAFYFAYRTTSQSIPNNTTTAIVFNADEDTRSEWDPAGVNVTPNSNFDARSAGHWLVVANVGFAANGSGYRMLRIEVNGVPVATQTISSVSGSVPTYLNVSTIIPIDSYTDIINVYVYQNSGGSLNVISNASDSPTCRLTRVGF
jgi:hypothetical protein